MNSFPVLDKNVIDLSGAETSANVLFELNRILEGGEYRGKKIKINLADISVTPDNMRRLRSIVEFAHTELEIIYTRSLNTQLAALSTGFVVSEKIPTVQEIEIVEQTKEKEITETSFQEVADRYETEKSLEELLEGESEEDEVIAETKTDNKTLYITKTIRSGNSINFDGNVVLIGDSHPGSEIIASGDITVWGILGGIAHAGSRGDNSSVIRALKISAIQLRIANLFARKPDRIDFERPEKTSSFTPEEARIHSNEIKIYSLNG